jgi:hypothetical protein
MVMFSTVAYLCLISSYFSHFPYQFTGNEQHHWCDGGEEEITDTQNAYHLFHISQLACLVMLIILHTNLFNSTIL